MEYLIVILMLIIWLSFIGFLYKIRQNITLKPPMTPERQYSEAELAAKAIGYWEKRGLSDIDEDSSLCIKSLMRAQERLIMLTGDYVPDEAKLPQGKPSPTDVLPPDVVSLDLVRKSKL
jgi:hypothetical protein